MSALADLEKLQDGWDGPHSKAIPTRVFAAYANLVAEFGSRTPADLEPMGGTDGSIQLEWERDGDSFFADLQPEGGLWLCLISGDIEQEREYLAFDAAVLKRFYDTGRIEAADD